MNPVVLAIVAMFVGEGVRVYADTTVTDYTYNPDAELTSITVTVDGGVPTTTYLTWDDFVPNANDPTTGTVSVADGRLIGGGGGGSWARQATVDDTGLPFLGEANPPVTNSGSVAFTFAICAVYPDEFGCQ